MLKTEQGASSPHWGYTTLHYLVPTALRKEGGAGQEEEEEEKEEEEGVM